MNVIKTDLDGVVIIEPRIFNDDRGYFFESFSERDFFANVREVHFVQDNESKSSSVSATIVFSSIIFKNLLSLKVNW